MAHNLTIGILGLGKMGMQIARRLHKKGHRVIAWNRSLEPRLKFKKFGGQVANSVPELVAKLKPPRLIWTMLPAGQPTKEIIGKLAKLLSKDDINIDGSNSFYLDSIKNANKLARYKIWYFDAGVSGGIHGEKNGFSLMVGGPKKIWPKVKPLFRDLAAGNSYGLVGKVGTGHFVKMIHNGIEYGMMEAIAEGFAVLNRWNAKLDLAQICKIWQNGSVIRSWLIELARDIFEKENFSKIVGLVHHTGEGEWSVKVAKKLGVDVRVIEDGLKVRKESKKIANQKLFRNKLLALLRNRFGGHEVVRK